MARAHAARGAAPAAVAAAALAALLLLPVASACSSFVVNCKSDGAVVTVRTLDFSADLTAYTVSGAGGGPAHCAVLAAERAGWP